jgi:hypothetical protein
VCTTVKPLHTLNSTSLCFVEQNQHAFPESVPIYGGTSSGKNARSGGENSGSSNEGKGVKHGGVVRGGGGKGRGRGGHGRWDTFQADSASPPAVVECTGLPDEPLATTLATSLMCSIAPPPSPWYNVLSCALISPIHEVYNEDTSCQSTFFWVIFSFK